MAGTTGTPLVPDVEEPPPAPAPSGGRARPVVVCEFCECPLNGVGQSIKLSDRALQLRDQEDDLRAAKRAIVERDAEIVRLRAELTTLATPLPAADRKSLWSRINDPNV